MHQKVGLCQMLQYMRDERLYGHDTCLKIIAFLSCILHIDLKITPY